MEGVLLSVCVGRGHSKRSTRRRRKWGGGGAKHATCTSLPPHPTAGAYSCPLPTLGLCVPFPFSFLSFFKRFHTPCVPVSSSSSSFPTTTHSCKGLACSLSSVSFVDTDDDDALVQAPVASTLLDRNRAEIRRLEEQWTDALSVLTVGGLRARHACRIKLLLAQIHARTSLSLALTLALLPPFRLARTHARTHARTRSLDTRLHALPRWTGSDRSNAKRRW